MDNSVFTQKYKYINLLILKTMSTIDSHIENIYFNAGIVIVLSGYS